MLPRYVGKLPVGWQSRRYELYHICGRVATYRSAVDGLVCCSFQRPKHNLTGQNRPAHNGSVDALRSDSLYIHGGARAVGGMNVLPRHHISPKDISPVVDKHCREKDATGELTAEEPPSSPVGLRPETAPASTPIDLGCKAYYMARTIDTQTVRSRLYAGFPYRFDKHCVVIGPLNPNCFDGGYPRPRDEVEGLGHVLRELSKRKGNRGSGTRKLTDPQRRPFVTPPHFTAEAQEYQPRAWEMWEPAGGSNTENLALVMNGRMKDVGNSYVVIFNYGSVVFLDFNESQQEEHLRRQRDFLYEEDKIMPVDVKTETHGVVLWSTLPEPARLEPDCTTLRELDVNHITIIGTVLGQTVALDHYGDLVDSMMTKFAAINNGVEKTGTFTGAQKKELFQLVARNNTVRTDVISKLGILERSEAAWKHQDYNYVWEGLREEFEMDSRLRTLESKLGMLQQNTNFFIEMLHNQKSTMLEWTIIVLIAAEIVVGVCDLLKFKPFSK